MNPIVSIFSGLTFAISYTSRCTIGFPAMGNSGLGVVSVWGRKRLPRPAIGIIIFMQSEFDDGKTRKKSICSRS